MSLPPESDTRCILLVRWQGKSGLTVEIQSKYMLCVQMAMYYVGTWPTCFFSRVIVLFYLFLFTVHALLQRVCSWQLNNQIQWLG